MVIDSTGKVVIFGCGTVNVFMTKNQLIQLVGEPNITPGRYLLGIDENDCQVSFTFGDYEEVLGYIYKLQKIQAIIIR